MAISKDPISGKGQPRRSARGNDKDPAFIYNTPPKRKGEKRKMRDLKQKEMKATPETLFCDFGEKWSRFQSGKGGTSDVQFYTKRIDVWKKEILE